MSISIINALIQSIEFQPRSTHKILMSKDVQLLFFSFRV